MAAAYIYDLEVFPNFFLAGFLSKDSDEPVFFEISDWSCDGERLLEFLRGDIILIGFNNLKYDYPLLHYGITKKIFNMNDPAMMTSMLYGHSQTIIDDEYSSIAEWNVKIPQLDLFKLHHLDNEAKRTSLKDIEFVLHHENVEDLPYSHYSYIIEDEERIKVIDYNEIDLRATKRLYERSRKEIDMRKTLSQKYKINLLNANDPKIGVEIFASKLSDALKIDVRDLRKMQTFRQTVTLGECVFPYINFQTEVFRNLLDRMKKVTVVGEQTKDVWSEELIVNTVKYSVGLGGIHGRTESGIYSEDEDHIILSSDVTSYYPNLAIKNKFYPQHLTQRFCEVYEEIFNERKQYPKKSAENYGLKIALNGVYGKSNDKFSFFKDIKYMLTTTINGQLLLLMLCEKVNKLGQILMVNTDGIEIRIPRKNEQQYYQLCKEWEEFTRLSLEHARYRKLVIRDVNNYMAVPYTEEEGDSDTPKEKGAFEVDKFLWKDHSELIIPKAIRAYYIDNIPVSKFIKEHKDIFDFYIRLKIKGDHRGEIRYVVGDNINCVKLSKTTRYYVSNIGGYIYRVDNSSGAATAIKRDMKCVIANKHVEKSIEDYKINYAYYEREAMKIINSVDNGQLNLFK
jgi:hypothetical protein